jgi:multidrug efflux system membrane fusion protein
MRYETPSKRSYPQWAWVVLAAAGCAPTPTVAPPAEPPMVSVAKPLESPVVEKVPYNGRTEAVESVDVRARVSGYLMSEPKFKSGAEYKKDELLFVIDERPYKAVLDKAEGQIKLAEAKHKFDVAEVVRNEPLVKTGATTKSEFDKLVAARDESAAAIDAAKAAAESARLNYAFCRVTSPIDGRASRNYISAGNLVAADTTLLTTIVSQDPMYVYFDVDEPTMLRAQELIRAGKFKVNHDTEGLMPVSIGLSSEHGAFPHPAAVDFIDNKVDPSTGTLKVRAVLKNPLLANNDRMFSAGMFVRVQVPLGEPSKQMLVTERAIGSDQGQKYLYVVVKKNPDDKTGIVEYRPVKLGPTEKGGLRVISPVKLIREKEGLRIAKPEEADKAEDSIKPGDWIIVEGIQKARPDLEVRTTVIEMPKRLPMLEAKEVKTAK